ncbi:MAG: hypothetical protein AB7J35_17235 [Dehalococcoidia bacterium]
MAVASVKEELHQMIDAMDGPAAVRLLAMLSLADDDGEITEEELEEIRAGEEDLRLGRTVRVEDLERELRQAE